MSREEKRLIVASINTFLPAASRCPSRCWTVAEARAGHDDNHCGSLKWRGFLGPCVLVLSDVAGGVGRGRDWGGGKEDQAKGGENKSI